MLQQGTRNVTRPHLPQLLKVEQHPRHVQPLARVLPRRLHARTLQQVQL